MTSENTGLHTIGQLSVTAHDLKRAVRFYRDVLGMNFLFEAPPQMAFFDCDGIRLLVGVPEKPEFDHPSSIIYFKVDDIRVAYEALSGRGAEFDGEPHVVHKTENFELWLAFLRDSEGNTLALMSEEGVAEPS